MKKKIILIGSSTGGPIILEHIFAGIPDLPVTIIIVQHLRAFFMKDLQTHIQEQTGMKVLIAQESMRIEPGHVYIAPAEKHLVLIHNTVITLTETEKVNSARPSIDVMMKSMVPEKNFSLMGIILTGMGKDGVEGLQYVKSLGGVAIAQDPGTAPIRTMPLNAIRTGIIDAIHAPDEIRQDILHF